MARKSKPTRDETGSKDLLGSFLGAFENFVSQVGAEAVTAAGKGEQRILIESSTASLVGQTNKLTAFVRETAERLAPAQRGELDRFLRVQDGVAIANRGVEVSRQVLRSGVLGNIIHWLAQHLKELKKILSEILHFMFDLLHISYPDWLDKLIQILDQFFDLILGILGDIFGIDLGRTARQLSEQEVGFLHEWAAFEAIRVVRAGRRANNQDEAK